MPITRFLQTPTLQRYLAYSGTGDGGTGLRSGNNKIMGKIEDVL